MLGLFSNWLFLYKYFALRDSVSDAHGGDAKPNTETNAETDAKPDALTDALPDALPDARSDAHSDDDRSS
jgi:hypothetical protein